MDQSVSELDRISNPVAPGVESELYDRPQAAKYLNLSGDQVYRLMVQGHLPTVRLPGIRKLLFRRKDLDLLIKRSTEIHGK